MRVLKLLSGVLAAGVLAAGVLAAAPQVLANPKNALDAYVAKPDPAFAWKVHRAHP